MALSELKRSIEAILMVVEEPVSESLLAQITEYPVESVHDCILEMAAEYQADNRGFELRQISGGWRFYSHPDLAPVVERFVLDGQSAKLTQAALETLAVIAYRQPVSRARVSAIRGVNVEAVMKTLVSRGLVEEAGIEHETQAILYQTTPLFLEKIGLNSIQELPAIAPLLPNTDGLDEILSNLAE